MFSYITKPALPVLGRDGCDVEKTQAGCIDVFPVKVA